MFQAPIRDPSSAGPPPDPAPADAPSDGPQHPDRAGKDRRPRRRSRTALFVAAIGVAALSAGALFLSGYSLGVQHALTPGTSADNEALFQPYWEAYNKIVGSYVGSYTPKQLVEGSIKGMFDALGDPFSSYMTSEEYKASLSGISGEFEGIGAEMAAVDPDGQACTPLGIDCALTVVHVIRNSPAQKDGLADGDVITAIDGRSISGMSLDDAVGGIRGPRATQVTLSLMRDGQSLDLAITRDVVQTEDVSVSTLVGGTVADFTISGFSSSAADDFKTLLSTEMAAGIRQYVIDLRNDPGGFVDAALSIGNQFIASGPVYFEEDAQGHLLPHEATGDGLATDPSIHVVVLVNGGTASASEILAGALHDTGRATLVGTQTYGKGTIQQWILLSNDTGGFRLSTAKWLTPDKTWIHGVGITPDVVVEQPPDLALGQDPQLDAALGVLAAEPGSSGSAGHPGPASTPTLAPTPAPQGRLPSVWIGLANDLSGAGTRSLAPGHALG
jgi:carboxyl-terminal processing protease